jgi:HPt (histidine-containing phosphotransfer) domain-containing protein
MADSEFIKLLGYKVFSEISQNSINKNIKFENGKVYLELKDKSLKANYTETLFYTDNETITILKLSNIIETKNSVSKVQLNYKPIYLDVNKISKEIGLSVDDYKLYLDSFIDQSIIDEEKLFAGDDKAIKNLSNLALTLKIPNINILLLKIKKLPTEDRTHYIDEYYTKLALLTTKEPINYKENNILEKDNLVKNEAPLDSKFTELVSNIEEDDDDDMILDLLDTPSPSPKITAKKVEEKKEDKDLLNLDLMDLELNLEDELIPLEDEPIKNTISSNIDGDTDKIILENAPALPIHYNPKIAADELNLPVVLIEEFVEDFIEQAQHDKDHLLASYYQKDMDNIHELGHKLKGAASNLRINELADVLEEIQFCTEHSKLKSLFIKYWGLFISLEKYMQQPKQL